MSGTELLKQQEQLQDQARQIIAELDSLATLFNIESTSKVAKMKVSSTSR